MSQNPILNTDHFVIALATELIERTGVEDVEVTCQIGVRINGSDFVYHSLCAGDHTVNEIATAAVAAYEEL